MSDLKDFIIENGVLKKYVGEGGDVIIPIDIHSIDKRAFQGCNSLKTVLIPEGVTSIGFGAFMGCISLTSVIIPKTVAVLERSAFYGCESLKTISIPEGTKHIDCCAFYNCKSLISVNFPNTITAIEDGVFCGCKSLKSIELPNSIRKIGVGAFDSCESLMSIVIPNKVFEIDRSAFRNCKSLTSVTIPESVVKIGPEAFLYCDSIDTIITFTKSIFDNIWKRFSDAQQMRILCKAIYDNTQDEYIKKKIVYNKARLINIAIEQDNQEMISYLFGIAKKMDLCELENIINKASKSLQVTAWLLEYKRKNYSSQYLEEYENEKIKTEIGGKEQPTSYWKSIYATEKYEDGIAIKKFKGNISNVTIPQNIGAKSVLAIQSEAFSTGAMRLSAEEKMYRNEITSVDISNGVKIIGNNAFSGCKSLESVVIPDSIKEIGDGAFWYCQSLKFVIIPKSVTKIGSRAFCYCKSLTSIILSDKIKKIESATFAKCESLTSVVLPKRLTSIGFGAFSKCKELTSVTIPDSVTKIESSVFENCPNLTIHAPAGSYAEQYAKENNIPFVAE